MGYRLGVDLGTTYTAAAVWRDRDPRPELVPLAARGNAMPTVVFVDLDGGVLVGDAAEARAGQSPGRVAREFKRRLGDPAPIIVGGSPWSPEALLAEVLRATLARVASVEGGPPEALVLTHPADWGPYKLEQFRQVARLADASAPVAFVPEPVAAALHYASTERPPDGAVVAVYDLGGGTFDATVLRIDGVGRAQVLGVPEGIDRFGGIDIDSAVFEHVRASVPELFDGLDVDDPLTAAAIGQVRTSCRSAKEVLSEDTQATVVVALPTGMAQVRITRAELESSIRPQLAQTVGALRRALASAGVGLDEVDRVLLVGGASRTPAIAELVSGELGRPVAVDADAKGAMALGSLRGAVAPAGAAPPASPTAARGSATTAEVTAAPVTSSGQPGPPPPAVPRSRTGAVVGAVVVVLVAAAIGALLLGGGGDGGDEGASSTTAAESTTTTTDGSAGATPTSLGVPAGPGNKPSPVDGGAWLLSFDDRSCEGPACAVVLAGTDTLQISCGRAACTVEDVFGLATDLPLVFTEGRSWVATATGVAGIDDCGPADLDLEVVTTGGGRRASDGLFHTDAITGTASFTSSCGEPTDVTFASTGTVAAG